MKFEAVQGGNVQGPLSLSEVELSQLEAAGIPREWAQDNVEEARKQYELLAWKPAERDNAPKNAGNERSPDEEVVDKPAEQKSEVEAVEPELEPEAKVVEPEKLKRKRRDIKAEVEHEISLDIGEMSGEELVAQLAWIKEQEKKWRNLSKYPDLQVRMEGRKDRIERELAERMGTEPTNLFEDAEKEEDAEKIGREVSGLFEDMERDEEGAGQVQSDKVVDAISDDVPGPDAVVEPLTEQEVEKLRSFGLNEDEIEAARNGNPDQVRDTIARHEERLGAKVPPEIEIPTPEMSPERAQPESKKGVWERVKGVFGMGQESEKKKRDKLNDLLDQVYIADSEDKDDVVGQLLDEATETATSMKDPEDAKFWLEKIESVKYHFSKYPGYESMPTGLDVPTFINEIPKEPPEEREAREQQEAKEAEKSEDDKQETLEGPSVAVPDLSEEDISKLREMGVDDEGIEKAKSNPRNARTLLDMAERTDKEREAREQQEAEVAEDIENMSPEERESLGSKLVNFGYTVEELKNKSFSGILNAGLSASKRFGGEKGASARFFSAFKADSDKKAAEVARRRQDARTSEKALGNVGYVVGNTLKYGRIIGDFVGYTAVAPYRHFMLGLQFGTRVSAAGKEARFMSEELMSETRIQDKYRKEEDQGEERYVIEEEAADIAAEKAWKIYERALAENGGKDPDAKALEKAYSKDVPKDILNRLGNVRFTESLIKWDIAREVGSIQKDIDKVESKGNLTDEEKKARVDSILSKWQNRLHDYDRMITQAGVVDTTAFMFRTAENTGKIAKGLLMAQTAAILLEKANMSIWQNAGRFFAGGGEALTESVEVVDTDVDVESEVQALDTARSAAGVAESAEESVPGSMTEADRLRYVGRGIPTPPEPIEDPRVGAEPIERPAAPIGADGLPDAPEPVPTPDAGIETPHVQGESVDIDTNVDFREPAEITSPALSSETPKASGFIGPWDGIEADVEPGDFVETAKRGDSVWKMAEDQLEKNLGDRYAALNEAQKTYLIDSIKDKIAANPQVFGLTNPDNIAVGQKLDFSSIFQNQEEVNEIYSKATGLTSEQVESIDRNNAMLREYVREHPGERLTSEKVNEILGAVQEASAGVETPASIATPDAGVEALQVPGESLAIDTSAGLERFERSGAERIIEPRPIELSINDGLPMNKREVQAAFERNIFGNLVRMELREFPQNPVTNFEINNLLKDPASLAPEVRLKTVRDARELVLAKRLLRRLSVLGQSDTPEAEFARKHVKDLLERSKASFGEIYKQEAVKDMLNRRSAVDSGLAGV